MLNFLNMTLLICHLWAMKFLQMAKVHVDYAYGYTQIFIDYKYYSMLKKSKSMEFFCALCIDSKCVLFFIKA